MSSSLARGSLWKELPRDRRWIDPEWAATPAVAVGADTCRRLLWVTWTGADATPCDSSLGASRCIRRRIASVEVLRQRNCWRGNAGLSQQAERGTSVATAQSSVATVRIERNKFVEDRAQQNPLGSSVPNSPRNGCRNLQPKFQRQMRSRLTRLKLNTILKKKIRRVRAMGSGNINRGASSEARLGAQ